jgi:D-3-phosphoglycerate dehydrogenase
MKKVLFLDSVHPSLAERLTHDGYHCVDLCAATMDEIEKQLPTAHGLVLRSRYTMNDSFLSSAEKLHFIARSGIGMENVDLDYCQQRGLHVFNAPGANADAVGEHVVGMLLCLFNKLHTAHTEVRSGLWRREANRGIELGPRTVGIIGFGHTGQSVAKRLSGFGCAVLAYDKYQKVNMAGVEESTLKNIQERCDIISFHVPLTEETHHYFNDSFLEAMAKPFYLVNCSRGKVASTTSMLAGLNSKKIKGICLDVLEQEGADFDLSAMSDVNLHGLISNPAVLFSPHVAGWTMESYENLADSLYRQISLLEH